MCLQCGINLTTGDSDGYCFKCKEYRKLLKPMITGWVCPRCGAVYAPHINECSRCNPPMEYKVTY